jgi:hypothetical protein
MSEPPYLRDAGATARAPDADATETKSSRVARDALCASFSRARGKHPVRICHSRLHCETPRSREREQRSRPFAWVIMNQASFRIRTG